MQVEVIAQPRFNMSTGDFDSPWTWPEQMEYRRNNGTSNGTSVSYTLHFGFRKGVCGDGVCSPSEVYVRGDYVYVDCWQDCGRRQDGCGNLAIPLFTGIGSVSENGFERNGDTNITAYEAARLRQVRTASCGTWVLCTAPGRIPVYSHCSVHHTSRCVSADSAR